MKKTAQVQYLSQPEHRQPATHAVPDIQGLDVERISIFCELNFDAGAQTRQGFAVLSFEDSLQVRTDT
jgi:hypothetical protein